MRKLSFLILVLLSVLSVDAQERASKWNVDLYLQYQEAMERGVGLDRVIPVLIKGHPDLISSWFEAHEGMVKYQVRDIASVEMPLAGLPELLENPLVQRLESQRVKAINLNEEDSVLFVNNQVTGAHEGWGILPYGFRGEGVIAGIIDDGFDWEHPDFRMPSDSSTRIYHLWDQNSNNSNYYEAAYGYGASWDKSAIDNAYITHNANNHGTHVLGTTAGNGLAANKYVGVAPEADIVAVSISEQGFFLNRFVDAAHFIFNKATAMGKPCAINSSVGTYYGSHDGTDLYTELIEYMLDEAPGRALIQAAGNARQHKQHWQATLNGPQDTAKLWFNPQNGANRVTTSVFADVANLNNIQFSFEMMDNSNYLPVATSSNYNILQHISWLPNGIGTFTDTLFSINNNPMVLEWTMAQWNGVYELYISLDVVGSTNNKWQMTLTGNGKVDIWSHNPTMGNTSIYHDIPVDNYVKTDNQYTIVSSWTCSEKVITVGSYQNRAYLHNYAGDTIPMLSPLYPKGGISDFSSLGPTRDGRQKPDVTASGGQVMSAYTLSSLQNFRLTNNPILDVDSFHVAARGTSMSAPIVTGASVLYFQCQPNANWQQLKSALEGSAKVDSFVVQQVGMIPNIHWGYGKLDVHALLEDCMIYGCTDSTAPNYNPFAHIEDGSCQLISGVEHSRAKHSLRLAPNPAKGEVTLIVETPEGLQSNALSLEIYHLSGKLLKTISNSSLRNYQVVDLKDFSSGTYYVVLKEEGMRIDLQKLMIIQE